MHLEQTKIKTLGTACQSNTKMWHPRLVYYSCLYILLGNETFIIQLKHVLIKTSSLQHYKSTIFWNVAPWRGILMFRWNVLPPCSGSKSKSSKKHAASRCCLAHSQVPNKEAICSPKRRRTNRNTATSYSLENPETKHNTLRMLEQS
jgi:hypothetical protein